MALGYGLTVAEVVDYYGGSRPDLMDGLVRAAQGRGLYLTDWDGVDNDIDGAAGARADDLAEQLSRRVREALSQGYAPGDLPPRYPAFHATIRRDVLLEVDAKHSQRECFRLSRPIFDFLEGFGAPYRVKYSGNCSAHFIILQEAFQDLIRPEQWEDASHRFRAWSLERCGAPVDDSFTDDRHYLRLPYSLNERTGLLSVPIDPEKYDAFEPAMAELPNVRYDETWFLTGDFAARREGMRRMLHEALGDASLVEPA